MKFHDHASSKKCFFCESKNLVFLDLKSQLKNIPQGLTRKNKSSFQGNFCKNCRSVYSISFFDKTKYEEGYYSNSKSYSRLTPSYDYTGNLMSFISKASNGKKVLDFGAGQGSAALFLQSNGINIDVLEPDAGYRDNLTQSFENVFKDIESLKSKYSIIYSVGVLEHLEDIEDTIKRLLKKLCNSGFLIFQFPNVDGLTGLLNLKKWDMLFEEGHNFIPSLKGLEIFLNRRGIKIHKSYTSSIISRGRIPFYPGRNFYLEKYLSYLKGKSSLIRWIYEKAWNFQSSLGLGETLVVIIKK